MNQIDNVSFKVTLVYRIIISIEILELRYDSVFNWSMY